VLNIKVDGSVDTTQAVQQVVAGNFLCNGKPKTDFTTSYARSYADSVPSCGTVSTSTKRWPPYKSLCFSKLVTQTKCASKLELSTSGRTAWVPKTLLHKSGA
jgi:hypothetical protein